MATTGIELIKAFSEVDTILESDMRVFEDEVLDMRLTMKSKRKSASLASLWLSILQTANQFNYHVFSVSENLQSGEYELLLVDKQILVDQCMRHLASTRKRLMNHYWYLQGQEEMVEATVEISGLLDKLQDIVNLLDFMGNPNDALSANIISEFTAFQHFKEYRMHFINLSKQLMQLEFLEDDLKERHQELSLLYGM